MSIPPYVMETLYKQGTIDYIPYDAMSPVVPMQRNNLALQGQYDIGGNYSHSSDTFSTSENLVQTQISELKKMSQGPITLYPKNVQNKSNGLNLYNNYSSADSFSYSNKPLGETSGSVVDEIRSIKTQPVSEINNQDSIRATLLTEEDKKGTERPLKSTKIIPKALISLAAIVITLVALFKGGKPLKAKLANFLSKLNPKNWF